MVNINDMQHPFEIKKNNIYKPTVKPNYMCSKWDFINQKKQLY